MATTPTVSSSDPLAPRTDFNPTPTDILIARLILRGLRLRALPRLPEEVALEILALAAYRHRVVRHRVAAREYRADDFWRPGPTAHVAGLYLTTDPLPARGRAATRATRVTVQVRSADQGWADNGGHGTYHNSHTWFEACVLRPVVRRDDDDVMAGVVPATDEGEDDGRLESVVTTTFRSPEDARQELRERGWDIVERNGRSTWLVHHNRMLLSDTPPCWLSCTRRANASQSLLALSFMTTRSTG